MNRERLEILAIHLEHGKLFHQVFDIKSYNKNAEPYSCGTSGCAIGELPGLFPEYWTFSKGGYPRLKPKCNLTCFSAACEFFDISVGACNHLFHSIYDPEHFGGRVLEENPTKEAVAANIRAYIALEEA